MARKRNLTRGEMSDTKKTFGDDGGDEVLLNEKEKDFLPASDDYQNDQSMDDSSTDVFSDAESISLDAIKDAMTQMPEPGELWRILDSAYVIPIMVYLSGESPTAPPLNNNRIANPDGSLKVQISENENVVIVPDSIARGIAAKFGEEGPPVVRNVLTMSDGLGQVEFYPPRFYITNITTPESGSKTLNKNVTLTLSRSETFGALTAAIEKEILEQNDGDIWDHPKIALLNIPIDIMSPVVPPSKLESLPQNTLASDLKKENLTLLNESPDTPLDQFLEECPFVGLAVYVPRKAAPVPSPIQELGLYPEIRKPLFSGASPYVEQIEQRARRGRRGLVGLNNMGNTCFMNSAIQCLSNTKELKEYFIDNDYTKEINRVNPLGMKGQMAEAFGSLLGELWLGSASSVTPRHFKQTIAKFAPQFSGFGQQDSQELLAFLLDGIHEDLNRIYKKPLTEAPDWPENGGDKDMLDVASTAWAQHRSRNDSIIVDLFQGQYRSTVICPDCSRVSVTFDPLMYVTLTLPRARTLVASVTVFKWDVPKDQPNGVAVQLEMRVDATISDLASAVAGLVLGDPSLGPTLFTTDFWSGRIYRAFLDTDPISEINFSSDTIYIYQAPDPILHSESASYLKSSDFVTVPLFHRPNAALPLPPIYLFVHNDYTSQWVRLLFVILFHYERYLGTGSVLSPLVTLFSDFHSGKHSDESAQDMLVQLFNVPREESFVACFTRHILEVFVQLGTEQDNSISIGNSSIFTQTRSLTDLCAPQESWSLKSSDSLVATWKIPIGQKLTSPQVPIVRDPKIAKPNKKDAPLTIYDCLSEFTREEQLGKNDTWYCSRCKDHKQALKKVEIWSAPEILVFAFKRFGNIRQGKITDFIDFPLTDLDMSEYLEYPKTRKRVDPDFDAGSFIYDLYAVDNHMGFMGGGHYTANALNPEKNSWFTFNDSFVSPEPDPSSVKSSAAYLLFYRRRTSSAPVARV